MFQNVNAWTQIDIEKLDKQSLFLINQIHFLILNN